MATKRKRVNVTFTPEELTKIRALAKQMGLSISELLRRLSLGHQSANPENLPFVPAIRQLLEVNANQARLGNQLKQVLDADNEPLSPATISQIDGLITEIRDIQHTLQRGIEETAASLHVAPIDSTART